MLNFSFLPNVVFFQDKFYAQTFILVRDMLGKTSWYSIDVSGNDRCHVALLHRKYHFCHLLPFAKVYRAKCISYALTTSSHLSFIFSISETAFWRNVWKVTSNSGSSWRSFCHRMYNSSYLQIGKEDKTCEKTQCHRLLRPIYICLLFV